MQKIFLLLIILAGVLCHSLQASPTLKVNQQAFLAIPAHEAIGFLTSNGFTLVHDLQTDHTLFLTIGKNSDVTVLIHTPSSFSNINALTVQVLLSEFSLNPDADPNIDSLNILTTSTFELIAKSLAFLPCAEKENFLRSGFTCPNMYKVQYSMYEGGLNGLRKWLGIVEDKQLLISIVPLPPKTHITTTTATN